MEGAAVRKQQPAEEVSPTADVESIPREKPKGSEREREIESLEQRVDNFERLQRLLDGFEASKAHEMGEMLLERERLLTNLALSSVWGSRSQAGANGRRMPYSAARRLK